MLLCIAAQAPISACLSFIDNDTLLDFHEHEIRRLDKHAHACQGQYDRLTAAFRQLQAVLHSEHQWRQQAMALHANLPFAAAPAHHRFGALLDQSLMSQKHPVFTHPLHDRHNINNQSYGMLSVSAGGDLDAKDVFAAKVWDQCQKHAALNMLESGQPLAGRSAVATKATAPTAG
jgi:hypothetical protein